mgnify:CR=1 FL=1
MVVCWLGMLNLLVFYGWDVTCGGLTENREFKKVVKFRKIVFCKFGNVIKA